MSDPLARPADAGALIQPRVDQTVGELLDVAGGTASELLLVYAEDNYRDFDALAAERSNFRGGLLWCYHSERWLAVVDFALVLDGFLDTQGYWEEDKSNLNLALEVSKNLGPGYEQRTALLLHNLAVIYMSQGEYERARSCFERALLMQQQLGDKSAVGRALHYLGRIHEEQREYDQARGCYAKALRLGEEAGDDRGAAATLHGLGNICLHQGAYEQAEEYYERSLGQARTPYELREKATTLHQLGILYRRRGDGDRAERYLRDALGMRRAIGHREGVGESLFALGQLAHDRGDLDLADALWRQSLDIFEHLGMPEQEIVKRRQSALLSGRRRAAP